MEVGNVEYKLKLINPTDYRIEHLVTQMKWRLNEGGGEAIYEIGVADNGEMTGLTEDEMSASMKTLNTMASKYASMPCVLGSSTPVLCVLQTERLAVNDPRAHSEFFI